MTKYRFFDPEYDDFLQHSGTLGMKWGVRNYQYTDGTWTELGKERRRTGETKRQNVSLEKPKERVYKDAIAFTESIYDDVETVNKSLILDEFNIKHNPFRKNNCGYCSLAYELRRRGVDARAKLAYNAISTLKMEEVFGRIFDGPESTYMGTGFNRKAADILDNLPGQILVSPGDQWGYRSIAKPGSEKEKEDRRKFNEAVKKVRQTSFTKPEIRRIEKELVSQGDGARGIMTLGWKSKDGNSSAAHYCNYEVYNKKVYLIDCQDRTVNRGLGGYLQYAYDTAYIRTDNCELNSQQLKALFGRDFKRKE